MNKISRRALFGLSVGAVAAKAMPAPELRAETYFTEQIVGMDFGKKPAMLIYRGRTQAYAEANPEQTFNLIIRRWAREQETA